jgi:hypothetical protein
LRLGLSESLVRFLGALSVRKCRQLLKRAQCAIVSDCWFTLVMAAHFVDFHIAGKSDSFVVAIKAILQVNDIESIQALVGVYCLMLASCGLCVAAGILQCGTFGEAC